jgi:hypothetical protein
LTHNPKFKGSGPATGSRRKENGKKRKSRLDYRKKFCKPQVLWSTSSCLQSTSVALEHLELTGLTVQNIFNSAIGILIFVSKALFTLANHHCKSFSDSKSVFTCLGYSGGMTINVLYSNKTSHIRHQCRKTTVLSCHRFLINTGVEKINNI